MKSLPHSFSAIIACCLMAGILFAGRIVAIHLEHSTVHSAASKLFPLKTQGLAFQRAAAHAPDVLPLYGSSELLFPRRDRASDFFSTAPTGFQVSPVGKQGATTMIFLQKLGALGSDLHGKKLAISLSPEWFFMPDPRRDWYEGNFSLITASEMAFGNAFDFELKREIASRMLQFPRTLAKSPLLEFALERLASGQWSDRVVFYALWPLGKIQNVILNLQDHFAALSYVLRETKSAPRRRSVVLDWPKIIAKVSEHKVAVHDKNEEALRLDTQTVPPPWRNRGFVVRVNTASEWMDLELLLRALATARARPLLLSMPIAGKAYDQAGVSRSSRETYYEKMRAYAQRYNFPLVQFEEHDDDPAFLDRQQNHLTTKGWMFYNRALDDFFHDRTPES
jgi:D-alanine transfer protein